VVWEGIGLPSQGEGSLLGFEFLSAVLSVFEGEVGFFVCLNAVHLSAFGAYLDDLQCIAADGGRRTHGPDQPPPDRRRPYAPAASSPRSLVVECAPSSGSASAASAKRQRVAVVGNVSASDRVAKTTRGRTQ
jgi:hypothetical protein